MQNYFKSRLKCLRNCRQFSLDPRNIREILNSSVNWYPGHMEKGLKSINAHMSAVDVIIELHDARLPFTGRCSFVQEAGQIRPRIMVLNKCDLAEPVKNPSEFRQQLCSSDSLVTHQQLPMDIFFTNMKSPERQKRLLNDLLVSLAKFAPIVEHQYSFKREFSSFEVDGTNADSSADHRPVVTAMVVGLPNCGKSSLINALRSFSMTGRRKAVAVGKNAGRTRNVSGMIVISHNFPLSTADGSGVQECSIRMLDTPGILEPRATTLCGQLSLGVCGSINWDSVDIELLADYLLFSLNRRKLFSYAKYYRMRAPTDNINVLLAWICAREEFFFPFLSNRHYAENVDGSDEFADSSLQNLPRPDFNSAARHFLRLFCEGRFGRITFLPDDEEAASNFFVLHGKATAPR